MLSITLRIILILSSVLAFILCVKKIKEAKLKVENSFIWMLGSVVLILMSIFSDMAYFISSAFGFIALVNFVFLIVIGFLLVQTFIDNIRISQLNEKIKDLSHYISLNENEENKNKS